MNGEMLKSQLSEEKIKLIEKYSLTCSEDMIWEFKHDKYHSVKYFSHKFAQKQSVLALLFYINRLCYAKIKYFEKNIDKYDPYKYVFLKGFCKCEIYDMEFLKHRPSNSMIDIRNLREIKSIEEFKVFCSVLDSLEEEEKISHSYFMDYN